MTANRNFVRFTHSKIIIAIYVQVFVKIFVKMWPSQSDPSAHRYRGQRRLSDRDKASRKLNRRAVLCLFAGNAGEKKSSKKNSRNILSRIFFKEFFFMIY